MGFSQGDNVFIGWPYFANEEIIMAQKNSRRESSRKRSRHHQHRSQSLPPRRNYLPTGREFKEDTVIRPISKSESIKPKSFRAGNLLIDVVETDSAVPFMRVRPRVASDDAFLFSPSSHQGFFKLRPCSNMSSYLLEKIGLTTGAEDHSPPGVFMDERIWLVDCASGWLRKKIPEISQK